MLDQTVSITRRPYGTLVDGSAIELFILRSGLLEVSVCSYGARIVELRMRGNDGLWSSVILSYSTLEEYVDDSAYMGAVVGRYANRIAHGRFRLDAHEYQLSLNDGPHSLHGGQRGFDRRAWAGQADDASVTFEYRTLSGEEGYPGSLHAQINYAVFDDELRLTYDAHATADTPVNLSNHVYFNLGRAPHTEVLDHIVTLPADYFTPVDSMLIPTGELRSVSGTPFDFREPHSIGERIDQPDPQLRVAKGYDHNWVLRKAPGIVGAAATIYEPVSRRSLAVLTSEPGVQFYTGNQLPETFESRHPRHAYRSGFCLETQHFPDSPNHPGFPSTILKAGERYNSRTIFRFSTK